MSGPDADRAKLVADLRHLRRAWHDYDWDFLDSAANLLEAFPDRLREAQPEDGIDVDAAIEWATREDEKTQIVRFMRAKVPTRNLAACADDIEANAHRPAEEEGKGAEPTDQVSPARAGDPQAIPVNQGIAGIKRGLAEAHWTPAAIYAVTAPIEAALRQPTPSPAGSSPEPSEAEVEAAAKQIAHLDHLDDAAEFSADARWNDMRDTGQGWYLRLADTALRAAYALRSTPRPAEAPSDGFTAEASQAPVGDKDRAELQPGWLKRDIERAGLRIEQWAAMSDGQRITHLEAAHERDGQTIADLRRGLAEADIDKRRLDNVIAETQQNRNQYALAVVGLRQDLAKAEAALVSIRSQVEAETTERIVAWLRDGEVAGWSHATAIARGDHLKATQLPPTGANESEGA